MQTRRSNPIPRRGAQSGFSLIEIILVVVLIGGIVAFAATRILGGGDRAKYNLAKSQVQTLAEKVQQFENDTVVRRIDAKSAQWIHNHWRFAGGYVRTFKSGAEHVAEIGIAQAYVGAIVQE